MANQNLELLIIAAKLLRPVLEDLVFVGGCATGFSYLLPDEASQGRINQLLARLTQISEF